MTLRALLAAAVVLGLLPAAASASSIAYIKEGNVWLISPDGARDKQVTTDATATTTYTSPSQADDGTILAKRGTVFVRLRPDGTRIGDPVPAIGSDAAHSGNLTVMAGPADARISPDGTRFSYWISARAIGTCPPFDPDNCSFSDTDYTFVSRADRFTPGEEFGAVRDYRDASWVGNDRLLLFNYGLGVKQGAISPVGAGEAGLQQWFDPPDGLPQIGQGQLTRAGDKLVTLAGSEAFGPSQERMYLYSVAPGGVPVPKCADADAAPPSGRFLVPSWSPDGTAVAVTQSDGIHIYEHIPDLSPETVDCGAIGERVLVRGALPAWGPADVPAGSGAAPAAGGAAFSGLAVAKRRRGRAVRVRLRVLVAGSTVRARLVRGGRVLGRASKRAVPAGPLTLRVRLNARGRAALRARETLRLRVRVSAGGQSAARVVVLRGAT
jgi:hypothetical protein